MEKKADNNGSSPEFWELRLYVAGQTPKSLTAFANLKKNVSDRLQDVRNSFDRSSLPPFGLHVLAS